MCGVTILGIESSCDDTSAGVVRDGELLSNVTYSQAIHEAYGGVVPELAARAHEQKIVVVVREALSRAGVKKEALAGIAVTTEPGLVGSLLVGELFAAGLGLSLGVEVIRVNHLRAHALVHYMKGGGAPAVPWLCLLVSGGNTMLMKVKGLGELEVLGETLDDAAGEAFDKCGKALGLGYPGGAKVSALGKAGDAEAYKFAKPRVGGYDYSFSGLKTSFLYTLRDKLGGDEGRISAERANLCASLERTIVEVLLEKVEKAVRATGIKRVGLAGGVSANEALQARLGEKAVELGWEIYIPPLGLSTDNGGMVALTGYLEKISSQGSVG
jgi:N6-L-threonylcarbamoyladenine synthase